MISNYEITVIDGGQQIHSESAGATSFEAHLRAGELHCQFPAATVAIYQVDAASVIPRRLVLTIRPDPTAKQDEPALLARMADLERQLQAAEARVKALEGELAEQVAYAERLIDKGTNIRRLDINHGTLAVDLEGLGPKLMAETFLEIVRRCRKEGAENYMKFCYETDMNPVCGRDEYGDVRQPISVMVFFNEGTTPAALLTKRTKELNAALARIRELTEWRPMDTAPKNEPVLAFGDTNGVPWVYPLVAYAEYPGITHWLPLPDAPRRLDSPT